EKHDFTDQERLDCLLESLTYATEALRLTALLDGPFHLDVGKRIKLIARIVGELIGRIEDSDLSKTRGTLDPSTDKSFEKLCSDADEISGLFALLPKDDVVRLHRFYSDEIERLLHVVIDGGISVDEGESPTQVANLLVRGDEVDPNTLFDFKGPSKLKGLLKPFFEKRFDPWRGLSFREASEADAESIRDLMVSARNSCSQPDFYAISDVDRIRNKFSNGARAVLAFKNQELVAFYIATPLVGDERSWLGKAIDIPDEALDHAWCMDSVAVADTCRGLGLQRKLAEDLESELIGKGVEIFAATVDPRNTPSIRNFILGGYDIVDVDERFFNGESPRALMVKYADGRCPELKDGGVAIDLSDSE
ncbi:MAG: GNAT family N-acetyltransferase, partial [Collinsella sp.]|nr:GNAT family N-acetyltransferase [Collinsella sp.]